ncbi:hypothetical protein J6590_074859 [Homalodisca vitripennis]|nr:hypothetical protein J6590_074859 [Homalodisca vitripennis]
MWWSPLLTQEFKEGALSKPFRNFPEVETSCCLLRWAVSSSRKSWWLGLWLTSSFLPEDEAVSNKRVDDCCGVFSPSSLEPFKRVDKLLGLLLVYLLNLLSTPL